MRHINLFTVNGVAHLVHPDEFHELTPMSPAMEFFTDFKKHLPLTIEGSAPAENVEHLMRKAHVKMKLVVDQDNEFIGTISLEDLDEQHFMARIAKGNPRQEIQVADLMRPKAQIMALSLPELEEASISDVIRALQLKGQQHCLVVDPSGTQIRGLISASDVARRLRIPIQIERVPTFVDIFSSIRRPAA
ncbi:MAG: CBS domain-containing protein [Pseudomonadales bacterium]|nr:CBS domain-containing protein [Pseudomonadales bacterium]MCP5344925.1 CBS domain-containing protein [Pseudomonadales bacterium]